jgi:hypothetical protein
MYRNLLNGFTTVVNHGPKFRTAEKYVNIVQETHDLHSVDREKFWRLKLNQPFSNSNPFVIHAGEGTDTSSGNEIDTLIKWNLFRRKLVAVHGVAMNVRQAKSFAGLIWCPATNFFLLNATAKIDQLKDQLPIVFGTDSTLTAPWNAWAQIRQARATKLASDAEIFDMLTVNPVKLWRMEGIGRLDVGSQADIVVARSKNKSGIWDGFYQLNPEDILLVVQRGKIRLWDIILTDQLKNNCQINRFSKVYINGAAKFVEGDMVGLIHSIRKYLAQIELPVTCD